MIKIIFRFLFSCFLIFQINECSAQIPAESNPHRGMYVDRFVTVFSNGTLDPVFSVLGVDEDRDGFFEKEDELLEYCRENHITYLALYDMGKILGRNRTAWNENTRAHELLERHLCRFIEKAKREYCVDQIGGISGSNATFDSLHAFSQRYPVTNPYRLRRDQINSPFFHPVLYMVENNYEENSEEQNLAEQLKFALRVSDFNSCGECQADIDYINLEDEFWADCVGNFNSWANRLHYMNSVKQMHNSVSPNSPWLTELYLGSMYPCLNPYMLTSIARTVDGCNNCSPCTSCANPHPKLIDRVLLAFLTNHGGIYDHFATTPFAEASTSDSTDFHPLLYSESHALGGFTDYLGLWFTQSYIHNIFLAETYFFNSWNNQAQRTLPRESNVQPGGAMWFAQSYQVRPQKNPSTFYYLIPPCDTNNTVPLSFHYCGPPEAGTEYEFNVIRNSDSAIVYPTGSNAILGITNGHSPASGPSPEVTAVPFRDTTKFPPMFLPPGEYMANLKLKYEGSESCAYTYSHPVLITDKPDAVLIGDSVFCEGEHTWMLATPGTSHQWFRNGQPIPGGTNYYYKASLEGFYHCLINGTGPCAGVTDSIQIRVRKNPAFNINAHCNGNNTVTLIAHSRDTLQTPQRFGEGGVSYRWSNGATTDRITVPLNGTRYRVLVTDPYSGCTNKENIGTPSGATHTYSFGIQQIATPSGSCASNGALQAVYTPAHNSSTSYQWTTGERSASIYNLYPGTYNVVSTVWDNACSYFASFQLGTLPSGGPQVNSQIDNASCFNVADGSVSIQLSGGNAPFTYYWDGIPHESPYDHTSPNQSGLYPGIYTLNIFDASGCRFSHVFTVGISSPEMSIGITSISPVTLCSNNNNGAASIQVTGGTLPYSYSWNDSLSQTSSNATTLGSGTWIVTVTDGAGCSLSEYVSIPSTPPMQLHLEDTSIVQLTCAGDSSGYLKVCFKGGLPPYSVNFPWNMIDSIHAEASYLQAGLHTLIVTDSNSCVFTFAFRIYEPPPIQIQNTVIHESCVSCADGSFSLNMSGGVAPYIISINPPVGVINANQIDSLSPGIYEICITDAENCVKCISDTIIEFPNKLSAINYKTGGFIIQPNPSGKRFKIILDDDIKNLHLDLSIFDIAGRELESFSILPNRHIEFQSELSSGVYLMILKNITGNQVISVRKWIMQQD
ncbi:MAG: T9SS C-terminal target domain-containing protein [Bacteroidetes bacterium]|nr:MAG: T9SS C-terminal target domain-containing protein [Bacteroidota bacterium]REK06663.1 MAG: T9SS C-terminal target domain-containing protein [Bacteroidota bacterium]REK33429.1 MAG: T9SS C-terminal target domain-containing protein [Bacteroidota bacterium]REK49828.1 MAG: T9SS C-terminal target domain-containing protein [Bacteroidota bacterium]